MEIQFGMYLDGVVWSNKEASIGEVRTGPMGLRGILETKLGISKPESRAVYRIDAYMKRLNKLDSETAWYHQSFATDQWSTAEQLLKWRDEMIEAGWKGESFKDGSTRLKTLAELEKVTIPLPDGCSDRLQNVIKSLMNNNLVQIAAVNLTEPLETLPPVWQKILSLLEKQGTKINHAVKSIPERVKSNLSIVQSVLSAGEAQFTISDEDDSLIVLETENEWEAAEQLALWLVSNEDANKTITIICGRDTTVLDQALRRHGLPCLGRSEISRWREIQQILPLVLANAWEPVDIRSTAQLLSLSETPVKGASYYLLRAIAQEPGIGGKAWNAAIEEIRKKRQKYLKDNGEEKAEKKAQKYIEEIQILLQERYDPVKGIPEDKLYERCQKVIKWAEIKKSKEPMMAEVIKQARDLQMISLGKSQIPRLALDRMLDNVIGTHSGFESEETAFWQVVDHPGQITEKSREIVWWGFNESDAARPTYWSKKERLALSLNGVMIEDSKNLRLRETQAWQRALMFPEKRFIGIFIRQIDGEEEYCHPLIDSIINAALQKNQSNSEAMIRTVIVKEVKKWSKQADWKFAGRENTLKKADKNISAEIKAIYNVPKSVIKRPESLSYTRMSTLIGCPLNWALKHHASLQLPKTQSIPTGNRMIGTLCHRIVEELYSNNSCIEANEAKKSAEDLFEQLLPSMASELLLEGQAQERQRYKRQISEAVEKLAATINRLGLTVDKLEAPLEGDLEGIHFKGVADMVLKDKDENLFVFDLKWTNDSQYLKKEVKDGEALQLASYTWMITAAEPMKSVDAGYFLLDQGELFSDSVLLGNEAIKVRAGLDKVWEMGCASLDDTWRQIDSGVLYANGLIEKDKKIKEQYREKGLLYIEPKCNFCDFKRLCGLMGGE